MIRSCFDRTLLWVFFLLFACSYDVFAQNVKTDSIALNNYSCLRGGAKSGITVDCVFPESGAPENHLRMLRDSLMSFYFGHDYIGMTPQAAVDRECERLLEEGYTVVYMLTEFCGLLEPLTKDFFLVSVSCSASEDGEDVSEMLRKKESAWMSVQTGAFFRVKDILAVEGISDTRFDYLIKESLMNDGHTSAEINFGKVSGALGETNFSKRGVEVSLPTSVLNNPNKLPDWVIRADGVKTTIPWNKLTAK